MDSFVFGLSMTRARLKNCRSGIRLNNVVHQRSTKYYHFDGGLESIARFSEKLFC